MSILSYLDAPQNCVSATTSQKTLTFFIPIMYNQAHMAGNNPRKGFTIIEVMLFLSISAFLLIGIMAGASINVSRQRYNSSVQELAEFLRSQYSAVVNIQNGTRDEIYHCASDLLDQTDPAWQFNGGFNPAEFENAGQHRGRSNCLIYGRVIIFGDNADDGTHQVQSYNLLGKDYISAFSEDERTAIQNHGHDEDLGDPILNALAAVKVSPFTAQVISNCSLSPSDSRMHSIRWDAQAQQALTNDPLQSTIIIVRSPIDGAIHTYASSAALEVNQLIGINLLDGSTTSTTSCAGGAALVHIANNPDLVGSILIMRDKVDHPFEKETVEVCVGSGDVFAYSGNRRMIRILRNGRNASAIELMDMDGLRTDPDDPNLGGPWCL